MWRDKRLRGLSSDHHQALVLARRLAQAVSDDERRGAVEELLGHFDAEINPHFLVEERLLLPALREFQEAELVRRTEDDHAWLRAEVARARRGEMIDTEAYGTRFRDHVRFEELELFERCQELFPNEVLDVVWDRWPKDESKRAREFFPS